MPNWADSVRLGVISAVFTSIILPLKTLETKDSK